MSQRHLSRTASARPARTAPSFRRRLARANRTQLIFAVLGILVVCSLLAGAVGTIIVDQLTSPSTDDTFTLNESEPDPVETELRRDVEENPQDASAAAALANYLANIGNLTEAIDWYERALQLEPDNMDFRLDFAISLSEGNKRADAELQFEKVLEAQPDNAEAHYYLAELYRYWAPPRTDEAALEYQLTIETGPDTLVAELAAQALKELGYATPVAGTPAAEMEATP